MILGCSTGKIKYYIEKMTKQGLIKHEGSTKAGKWIIIKQNVKNVLYIILSGPLLLVLVVVLIGTLLPRTRTETKQCILNAPVDAVLLSLPTIKNGITEVLWMIWMSSVPKGILKNGKRRPETSAKPATPSTFISITLNECIYKQLMPQKATLVQNTPFLWRIFPLSETIGHNNPWCPI